MTPSLTDCLVQAGLYDDDEEEGQQQENGLSWLTFEPEHGIILCENYVPLLQLLKK